ncbi:type I-B CRISPR-associated protein Cas5b [Bernardetia sp. Wsw4-3y2]|uniref:type I-B CRISPR-associated protein Cas5b n=1 Tax=Bernardetia sp. Wsw4-3y2 TaxID=3127471 RepID=UPI0030D25701
MQKLISIDLKADFGFFRKPDVNSGINLSYNMLHKPALLGILGAIIGLEGYKKLGELPEYYQKLKDLKIGIEPLDKYHERGNFKKTVIKYSNTIGYANKGTNYLTEEATLIKPAYRVYLLLDMENKEHQKLHDYLENGKAEYLPYFGKNEFSAWWEKEDFKEYDFEKVESLKESFEIKTLFYKAEESVRKNKVSVAEDFDIFSLEASVSSFSYFERIPTGFDEELFQYELGNFAFTNFKLKKSDKIETLYHLKNENYYVQLL